MKSRKNLTRFTYDTTAFQGWRLNFERSGSKFTKYFSDKQYGGPRKSFKAASDKLEELKALVYSSRLVNGKLSKTTINKGRKLLASS